MKTIDAIGMSQSELDKWLVLRWRKAATETGNPVAAEKQRDKKIRKKRDISEFLW